MGEENEQLNDGKHILVKDSLEGQENTIYYFLCLQLIKEGKIFHNPYEYTASPNLTSLHSSNPDNKYQQFRDTLIILSEYNSQKNILDKYLRLYQVLENFMFKFPIVDLERSHGGKMFSIREFQRLYESINNYEVKMLKKMINRILSYDSGEGSDFKAYITTKWEDLQERVDDIQDINTLLKILGFPSNPGNDFEFGQFLDPNSIHSHYSRLIYSLRNSIVHNKETEFHLTHEALLDHEIINDTARVIMEGFLIPTIERIVFQLLDSQNDIVWYDGSNLTLWEEH